MIRREFSNFYLALDASSPPSACKFFSANKFFSSNYSFFLVTDNTDPNNTIDGK